MITRTHLVSASLFLAQPTSCEEAEEEVRRLLATLVVCVPGMVPVVVHQRRVHLLHPAVRLPVRQR